MRCRDRDCDCKLVSTCQLRQHTLESICMHTRELLIEKIAAKMHLDTGSVAKIVDNFFLRKFIEIAGDSVFVNFVNLLTSCKVKN